MNKLNELEEFKNKYVSIYPIKKEIDLSDIYKRRDFLNSSYCIIGNLNNMEYLKKSIKKYVIFHDSYNYYVYNHKYGELDYYTWEELERMLTR